MPNVMRVNCAILILLVAWSSCTVRSQLVQQIWSSSAFAPQSAAETSEIAGLNISNSSSFPALCSVRFSGTIVDSSASELLNFSIVTDGGVRLWIDDWLVIDAGGNHSGTNPQRHVSFLGVPFTLGVPRTLRLEYSRWGVGGVALLQLWFSGNTTSFSIVPASSYAPSLSNFTVQRAALRDRLEVPTVPWQTYLFASMGAHVFMPAGFALSATLAVAGGGTTSLGNIAVYRNGNPALIRPGLRSINGSDYTLLTISQWREVANATVTFETTVVPDSAGRSSSSSSSESSGSNSSGSGGGAGALLFLATCVGSGCSKLLLLVEPVVMAERAGSISAGADGRSLVAVLPGFPTVIATALEGGSIVPWSGAQPSLSIALDGGYAGFWTGAGPPPSVATSQAAIAAAAAATLASEASYGTLAPLWQGLSSVLAWNTIFTPYEGVVTPVSRLWDIWHTGYILFEWDTYFCALMCSLQGGIAKDLAYANIIQVTLGRTLLGFVPNGSAGPRKSYDRSEPQVGALILARIHAKWNESWLLEGLLPTMLSWNDWVWQHRRGEGIFAGADGFSDLMCLGSDPSSPSSDTSNNLQAAKYEGMDNSPLYDAPPAAFNGSVTHHMNMYDVGATALFASDTEATISMCLVVPCAPPPPSPALPPLSERLQRVQAAMNAHLWDESAGLYTNVLFNGSVVAHYAPTSAFPLLSGTPSDAQADAIVVALASPTDFCYNASAHDGPAPEMDMLTQWAMRDGRAAACLSLACTQAAIFGEYSFERVEAIVLLPAGGPAPGLLALNTFTNPATGDTALITGDAPPAVNFSFTRQEGWCYEAPPPPTLPAANLTLWYSASLGAYKTCGTPACENATSPDYAFVRPLCYAVNGTGPDNMPCRVGGASIARADAAFLDQNYWRGRAWGPHHMLLYLALERYDHLPAARATRLELVSMGAQLQLFNWEGFSVICENVNGIIGTCEDSGDADPFYTWGALFGFTSFIEEGFY